MKPFRLITIIIALLSGAAMAQQGPFGDWQGEIGPGIIDLGIFVTLEGTPAAASGTLGIPVQGLFDFPLGDVTIDGDSLSFTMPDIPGDPVFEGLLAGDRIEGTFTQGGQPLPFFLERATETAGSAAPNARPQEPVPPFPYRSEEVRYASTGATLTGTLTLPDGDGPFAALLLITGSGPQDRDEQLAGHRPFLVIADQLTRAGYAVLRVDDRGMGGSSGSDSDASYADLLTDVLAGIRFLAAHDAIDADRIGLLGHSQGGYLAPGAALASDQVAFVIMLAGPAVSGMEVLELQNELIIGQTLRAADPDVSDAAVAAVVSEQITFLRELYRLLSGDDFEGARALLRQVIETSLEDVPADQLPPGEALEQIITAQIEGTVSRSMQSFLSFDPQPLLRQLTVPVLAIYGSLDLQVDALQSAGPLRESLAAAGNQDYSIEVLAGLNHLLQPATTGSVDEYALIPTTIDPGALQLITDWLQQRF
jgi:pimeloyl-ACP methyl ester carboxylesterase